MQNNKMDQLIVLVENYLECWKQFNHFVNLGRAKKFSPEDEAQFLENKSVLVQELELVLASVQISSPTREDVHTLIASVPSLRSLGDLNEGAARSVENQWHRIYIGWHAILGQLKVHQRQQKSKSGFGSMFRKKK
jgi:hypothetical protein